MSASNLIELTYFDANAGVRLTAYADTIITEHCKGRKTIRAIRFGGYPEVVQALSSAIYGGGSIDAIQNGSMQTLYSEPKRYRQQLSHDGVYATATLMAVDDPQRDIRMCKTGDEDPQSPEKQGAILPRRCYLFCPAGDQSRLFEELDRKTAAPLIPDFRDYVLDELITRKQLRQMEVFSLREKLDAWVLDLLPEDSNVAEVLEYGLSTGRIAIPGAVPGQPDGFEGVENITS